MLVSWSGVLPCEVCKRGVGCISILCILCGDLVHKRYSGEMGNMRNVIYFYLQDAQWETNIGTKGEKVL